MNAIYGSKASNPFVVRVLHGFQITWLFLWENHFHNRWKSKVRVNFKTYLYIIFVIATSNLIGALGRPQKLREEFLWIPVRHMYLTASSQEVALTFFVANRHPFR